MAYRKKKLFKLKLRPQTIQGLAAIGLAVFAVVILLAYFSPRGEFLLNLHFFIVDNFSWVTLLISLVILQIAGLLSHIKSKFTTTNSIFGLVFLSISLSGISQAGNLGTGLYLSLSQVIPVPIGIFFIFLAIGLFGLTISMNLTLGEALEIVKQWVFGIKDFFKRYLHFEKKPTPVFLKDSTISSSQVFAEKTQQNVPSTNSETKFNSNNDKQTNLQTGNLNLGSKIIENPAGEPIIWDYPTLNLLSEAASGKAADRGDVKHNAHVIEKTLESFGITARVAEVNNGPAVTQYALEIALGTKLSKITSLQNDLALALAAPGQIRIEAPIPGRSLVGVEIPNRTPEMVPLRKILDTDTFQGSKHRLAVALGLDVSGKPVVADISKMPHCLIAGSTGSGKSVCINSFLISLLYRNSPNELKLILVDPKRVELSVYNNIPHLMTPVIVDLDKVLSALKWAVGEMDRRYKTFASVGVRNIEGYNEISGFQALPYIVIVIDEMADLMMFAPVEVEDLICRLSQMARATGIHLVLATQRPSVDVITGLIKANIPCRIAFNVTSMIDSRVIIDSPGAEKLIGKGDMLYIPADQSRPSRIQGTWISDKETHKVVNFLKSQGAPMQVTEEITSMAVTVGGKKGSILNPSNGSTDPMLEDAIRTIKQHNQASTSLLQRKLSVGYSRAARLMDIMQEMGLIGPADGSKPREIINTNINAYMAQKET